MHWISLCIAVVCQVCLSLYWYAQAEAPYASQTVLRPDNAPFSTDIIPAAHRLPQYMDFLRGKRLGLVVNHTSTIGDQHLVDVLLRLDCQVQQVYAPEHGFRGQADAGERLVDKVDPKTGLPVISLYGKNKRPQQSQLANIDLMIFDVQDVGTRFYTYTSTMTYVMEACAERGIPLLILDRPNPNGHYIDGPILESDQKSFVGLHPVPIVHGLTVAEYARMINEEGWLEGGVRCQLYHVECLNYRHDDHYQLPIPPSPNLPNMKSIYLYPSLCWFEGTPVSVGRGTQQQFQVYGHPDYAKGTHRFTPRPGPGAKHPKHEGKTCQGYDLSKTSLQSLQKQTQLDLDLLLNFYQAAPSSLQAQFFNKNNFFNKLAGTERVQAMIRAGTTAEALRASWEEDLEVYRVLRRKYLLYPEEG